MHSEFHQPNSKVRGSFGVSPSAGVDIDRSHYQRIFVHSYGDRKAELPFASDYLFTRSMAAVTGRALGAGWGLGVEIESGGPLPPRPGMKVVASFADAYFPKVEAILRESTAVLAREGMSAGAFAVGSAPAVPSLARGNDVYSRADRLPGVSIERNQGRFFWRLTKGRRELFLPIGSDQIRVNGDWRDVGRVVPMKDGTLYVPINLARWIAAG